MDRLTLAYSLMGVIVLAAAALIGWARYHSRQQTVARARAREQAVYARSMAERSANEDPKI